MEVVKSPKEDLKTAAEKGTKGTVMKSPVRQKKEDVGRVRRTLISSCNHQSVWLVEQDRDHHI